MKMRRGVVRGAWVLAAVCGALLPSAPVLAQASAAEVVQAGNRMHGGAEVRIRLPLASITLENDHGHPTPIAAG